MEFIFGNFMLTYLLLPLIGIIAGGVMFIVAKKNKLLDNKKAVFYLLLTSLLLAIPALFGLIDYGFMPYAYILLTVVYLMSGCLNLRVMKTVIDGLDEKSYYVEFLCVFVVMIVGAAFFSLIFNLCNELQYGLWASTCMLPFIFPSLYLKAYNSYMNIPLEIYSIWLYDEENREMDPAYLDYNKIIVVELELFKQVSDSKPLNIKAKASENVPFGIWFKVFIDDYNKKSPLNPVAYSDSENAFGWIFYVNSPVWGRKKYINTGFTFTKNKIKEQNVIIAKRVKFREESGMVEL
jgi:hypothetical protein